jgi:hypothetical protein
LFGDHRQQPAPKGQLASGGTAAAIIPNHRKTDNRHRPLLIVAGHWWPLRHWTDSKIQVHGLYCTIAVLLRALLWRRAQQAGLRLSMAGLLEKLGQIQQVINVYPARRAGQSVTEQPVLTEQDQVQEKLIEILGLPMPKPAF